MKKLIFLIPLLLAMLPAFCQEKAAYLDLVKAEAELKSLFEILYNEEILGSNQDVFQRVDSIFFEALKQPGSFNFPWNKLDKIGKLESEDGLLKIFSWLYMVSRNEYKYCAFIQVNSGKDESEVYKLLSSEDDNIHSEDFQQKTDKWHAKIYYDIVVKSYKRKVLYTLIGADFNTSASTLKTIEVLSLNRGKPVFRGDQFLVGGKVKNRIVLEYSADLAASVRYNKDMDMIVYDHLSPLHPIYTGNYQFYGPDGSYDGFKFEEGIWVYEEDVDARNRQ